MRKVMRRLVACVGLTWLAAAAAVLLGKVLEVVLAPLAVLFIGLVCVEGVRTAIANDSRR